MGFLILILTRDSLVIEVLDERSSMRLQDDSVRNRQTERTISGCRLRTDYIIRKHGSIFIITLTLIRRSTFSVHTFPTVMASNHHALAISSGDLVDLVSSSGSVTIYPSDDAILAVLQARFRADLPYTRIGSTNLLVINPYKILANVNDVSAKEYEERCYKDTSLPVLDAPRPLHPHLYDVAARVYLLMRRRNESQAVVTRFVVQLLFLCIH